ncbi:DUF2269 domain-containing protein [Mesorhizobium sp. C386A]|uniref:DUF2269 family protein n=1 Tax=unclassified Mesorhizobium TaxID=325217 RepID=UPI001FDA482E|nr:MULTISPECIES: DUF2269 family protein [unclassified Mesorhizobium]
MDWYSLFKFLHVMAAILWLGGGFAMLLVSILADRAGDDETLMVMLRTTDKLGLRMFVPASIATLASGLVLTSLWTGFSDLWVVIGLCGYAAAFLTAEAFVRKACRNGCRGRHDPCRDSVWPPHDTDRQVRFRHHDRRRRRHGAEADRARHRHSRRHGGRGRWWCIADLCERPANQTGSRLSGI